MLATGGAMLPVPTSGSKDCAKAGSPMTLAKVARIRTFFIAVSILEVLEPAFASYSPVYRMSRGRVFGRQTGHEHNELRLVPLHPPNCQRAPNLVIFVLQCAILASGATLG